jgi:ADP-heptose:LPS heptosyltransferase
MTARHLTEPVLVPVAERYIAAARRAGLVVHPDGGPAELRPTADDRAAAGRIARAPYVVLCPGAAHASKRWPAGHWRALALALAPRFTVVATGTAAERPLLAGVPVVDAFGWALGPTAALLAGARGVVANDSGLMHLATAVGVPVVVLFGPTAPAFGYGPYQATAQVLERALPCRPCSTHGTARCPLGHQDCLRSLVPDAVDAALTALVA